MGSNGRGIGVMDTLGGNQRTLTNFIEDGLPSFSPNGRALVFSSGREPDRKARIYQVNVSGGDDWQLSGAMTRFSACRPSGSAMD